MANSTKDTIYIDIEDEITAVIDKVVNAKHKIVALVLPKRATVFQSAVNMKLLNKAAKSAQKSLVLITSDKAILSIAGISGVHVAKSLTTKPEIPKPEKPVSNTEEKVDLSGGAAVASTEVAAATALADNDEAIELDNTDDTDPEPAAEAVPKTSKKKLMKIPDFSSFRLRVGLGIAAVVLLVILWFFGFVILPQATVTVNTDTSTTSINSQVLFRVGAEELDVENKVIPAEKVETEKIDSVKVSATGQKDVGETATGTVSMTAQVCDSIGTPGDVPAGTTVVSSGKNYITQSGVSFSFDSFDGSCLNFSGDSATDITATGAGESFNLGSGSTFAVAGRSNVSATGSASGGTTELVTIVSEEDVQKAEQQLKGTSKNAALNEMKTQLEQEGKLPVEETLSEGTPKTTVTPAVGEEAAEVEVTVSVEYSLLGAEYDDLSQILNKELEQKMGEDKKNIKDNGLGAVKFQLGERSTEADANLTIQTVATLGPEIDESTLKEDIAGKKRGDIEKQIESIDGVRSVSVEYSPFWITTTPRSADKITIVFNEPDEE